MLVDLHTHSLYSDGSLSPHELLCLADSRGVNMLAITDHDTVAGFDNLPPADDFECRVIAGIELSTQWNRIGIHILGLNIDPDCPSLVAGAERQQLARQKRAQVIATRLEKLGLTNTLEGATKLAGDQPIARPHFARYLAESGQVKTIQDAFRKYLGPGKRGDVRELWAEMDEVIDWIHSAGGVAVLAHPAKYKLTHRKLEQLVTDFKAAGGEAIEVVSGQQEPAVTARLGRLANRFGLTSSCGSDFHQLKRPWAMLGNVEALPGDCSPVWAGW